MLPPRTTDADIRRAHGRRIAARRQAAGLTQVDLADKLTAAGTDTSHQSVSMWESGLTSPTPARRIVIAELLGCRVADLFDLDDIAEAS